MSRALAFLAGLIVGAAITVAAAIALDLTDDLD